VERGAGQSPLACEPSLYLATRHFFGWYALNVLDLPPHVIALLLGHEDGGGPRARELRAPDAALARERVREAFRTTPRVAAVPVQVTK
jgi:hypothetical protein